MKYRSLCASLALQKRRGPIRTNPGTGKTYRDANARDYSAVYHLEVLSHPPVDDLLIVKGLSNCVDRPAGYTLALERSQQSSTRPDGYRVLD